MGESVEIKKSRRERSQRSQRCPKLYYGPTPQFPIHWKVHEVDKRFHGLSKYTGLTSENVKAACEAFYNASPGSCDILVGGEPILFSQGTNSRGKSFICEIHNTGAR